MTVTVNHAKTNAISDWTQAQLDEQIALGNFAPGTTLANIVLPSDWNNDHTLTGLGTMAEQDANSVAITGGSVNGTTIGATTPATGTFTTITGQTEVLKGTGQNLILRSQTLINASWGLNNSPTLANYADPLGGSTATQFTTSVSLSGIFQTLTGTTGITYTWSVYVKYVSGDGTLLLGNQLAPATGTVVFNSSAGTITSSGASIVASGVVNIGSGWYRVWGTYVCTGTPMAMVIYSNNANASSWAAWGVQYEIGSTLGTYIPTTTTAVYGTPSLSFSGVASIGLQSDGSLYETSAGTSNVRFYTNNIAQEQMRVSHTASAVNYVQVTGAATGVRPSITVAGSDATIGLNIAAKGGEIVFVNNGVGTSSQFSTTFTASSVNYLTATGSGVTGNAPRLYAQGSDTNISMAFQPKGTGAIDLAAGSSGVNISNGGTVTAITRTNTGSGYTTIPGVAVSAPTTAGGVTATATANMFVFSVTVANGGTGYTVGNILTLVGGTGSAGQVTVATVSGGVITGITNGPSNGLYSALPTTPAATTGGSGSGATINITGYGVSNFTITNAGSGYIEQPTITFSGGGGSGAAAYATVGSGTIVRSLGSTMLLQTTGGIAFGVTDIANSVNYIRNQGSATGNQVFSTVQGTDTNIAYGLTSKGTGGINFFTNLGNNLQLAVSHTASAVNYVQVTGAATGGRAIVSAQGSDANVGMSYSAKGTGISVFNNGNGTQLVLQSGATSSVNRLEITPTVTGSAPILSAGGTDTNIDLALTPKGTGVVTFGTYTAGVLTPTGYVTIKDSGGTSRRLLVG